VSDRKVGKSRVPESVERRVVGFLVSHEPFSSALSMSPVDRGEGLAIRIIILLKPVSVKGRGFMFHIN
jgi:hypothetical protein